MDQKILWDCHMHSSFSADSDTPMEKMIQTAADKGLMGICFTEHFDPDYPDTPENLDFSLNIPAYRQKLESLADAFKNQIQVNFGIELGLQPQLAESFSDLLKEVPFDFVIGSSHVVHGYDPYYPSCKRTAFRWYSRCSRWCYRIFRSTGNYGRTSCRSSWCLYQHQYPL